MVQKSLIFFLLSITVLLSKAQVYDLSIENLRLRTRDSLQHLLSAIGPQLMDTTLSTKEQQALFDPIYVYAQENRKVFTEIRKRYFKELPAPPSGLKELQMEEVSGSVLLGMFADAKYSTITLVQSFKPLSIALLIANFFQPEFVQREDIGFTELWQSYLFGNQVFVEEIQQNKWKLWAMNRFYVWSFILDLETDKVEKLQYSGFNNPAFTQLDIPFVSYETKYSIDKLYLELNAVRWNSYKNLPEDLENESSLENYIDKCLTEFYNTKQEQFFVIRKKIVQDLDKETNAQQFYKNEVNIPQVEKNELKAQIKPYFLQPEEITQYLMALANSLQPLNGDVLKISQNAIVGFKHKVLSVKDQVNWTILSIGSVISFQYNWNIRKGEVSMIKLFES
ncbi:hypothetical protein [Sphingobacterium sp. LRF_L2]|uniref:hypothetical protein n=1 Tax=Sphingobacterium sp. LRF_L2 TaxID=3369421 RepID=UPI003F5DCA80